MLNFLNNEFLHFFSDVLFDSILCLSSLSGEKNSNSSKIDGLMILKDISSCHETFLFKFFFSRAVLVFSALFSKTSSLTGMLWSEFIL